MNFLLTVGGTALVTFLLSYIRAGRFGVTILALGAGYLLALLWTDTLISYPLVEIAFMSWRDAVSVSLVVLPGLFALLFGRKQRSLLPRIVAASVTAVFVVVVLLPVLMVDTSGRGLHTVLSQYRDEIISVILVIGLFDVVLARMPKAPKRTKD